MHTNQKVVPLSPNISSISSSVGSNGHNLEGNILNNFKLKPMGTGATRNTLVENDSLSSYSWPEEKTRQNGVERHSGERASNGATRGSNEHGSSANITIGQKGPTVIDIENDQNKSQLQEPTYVEAYMKFMYCTCVSPYNPEERWSSLAAVSWSDLVLNVIQKILFSTVIGLSFVKSFFQVKHFVLIYMTYSDLEKFIDMMLYIMNAGTKVYYVYLFTILQKEFAQMLTSLDTLRTFRMVKAHINLCSNSSAKNYAKRLGISSIIMSLMQTTLSGGVSEWTPQKAILDHSYSTALGLMIWSKDTMGNDTLWDTIEDNYGRKSNMTNFILGTFGFIISFCSCLHNEATGDLMQTLAETLREEMQCLQTKINATGKDDQNITLPGFFRDNGEWSHSRLLTTAINDCNDTLDRIMKYKHVNNLMLYVFFVLNFLDGEYSLAFLVYLLYDICKSSYTYRLAAEASTLNETKMDWIRRLAWKSGNKDFLERVPLLLGETKAKPIGMGKGQFMINENFLYRFLGWVGSIFVLQAQSREAKAE